MRIISRIIWLLAAAGLLAVSCVKEQGVEPEALMTDAPEITATTAVEARTKASVAEGEGLAKSVVWDKGDAISVFYKNNANLKYELKGDGGSPTGDFTYAQGFGSAILFKTIYGVYPYDKDTRFLDGSIRTTFPAVQSFTEKTFDPKSNLMVAASETNELYFKHVGGFLLLNLYGEDVQVKEAVFQGNDGEILAGPAEVYADLDNAPTIWIDPETGVKTLTLSSKEPVAVHEGRDNPTEFWLVVPPTFFEEGFTVTVTDVNGEMFVAEVTSEVEIERNTILRMDPLCLKKVSSPFEAEIVWTYAEDAEVDHNLFYDNGEDPTVYAREAQPLGIDATIAEKYGEEIAGTEPESIEVRVADVPGADAEPEFEALADDAAFTVGNLTLKDGVLVADIEGFDWDKVYEITYLYALNTCDLTLTGTLTTTDRSREAVTVDQVYEYTFDINKLDAETGFGYIEKDPVEDSYYYWKSPSLAADIYAAFLDGGVVKADDFTDADAFAEADLIQKIMMANPAGTASGYVDVVKSDICLKTISSLTASVLKEKFNSGEQDPDDPYRFVGNDMTRIITTYIGQTVVIPLRLSYRVPAYDFLHLRYYTFNSQKEVDGFITKMDFSDNDGSILWWTQVNPAYFTEPVDGNMTPADAQRRISFRHALLDYDACYINLTELAFNVVDDQDNLLTDEEIEEAGLIVKFFYADETLADKSLPTPSQLAPDFDTYQSLWVDNSVFYYRTNEKPFIPVYGTLTVKSGDCDFPLHTRFDTPKAAFSHTEEILDYSHYALVRWTPFEAPVAEGFTIVLDENKVYREPLIKGIELKDRRPYSVSYYVIKDGDWVTGNLTYFDAEAGTYSTGGNGYVYGVLSKDAYNIKISCEDDIPAELSKLVKVKYSADGENFEDEQDEEGTLTPYIVVDYTSEVQFRDTATIPVTVSLESPWQEKIQVEFDVTITGVE